MKTLLQIGILVLFVVSFFKIYFFIPNNFLKKVIFFITYIWFTIGINVNFIMPLIGILNKEINKRKN